MFRLTMHPHDFDIPGIGRGSQGPCNALSRKPSFDWFDSRILNMWQHLATKHGIEMWIYIDIYIYIQMRLLTVYVVYYIKLMKYG